MNIKGLLGPNITPQVRSSDKVEKAGIKSDSAHDRDANGQQTYQQDQQKKGPMSEEQLQKAVEHLRQLPAAKEHHWSVELAVIQNKKFILIKDNLGAVIRKIPEHELWVLPLFEEARKGNLFKKTA